MAVGRFLSIPVVFVASIICAIYFPPALARVPHHTERSSPTSRATQNFCNTEPWYTISTLFTTSDFTSAVHFIIPPTRNTSSSQSLPRTHRIRSTITPVRTTLPNSPHTPSTTNTRQLHTSTMTMFRRLSERLSFEKPEPKPYYYNRMNPEEMQIWEIIVSIACSSASSRCFY